jgi:uridine kinase
VARAAADDDELSALLAQIRAECTGRVPPGRMRTRVLAVDGSGGAGKSSFAARLAPVLDGCQIVHTDDFASWDNPVNWWPDLIQKVLDPLSRGEAARFEPSPWEPGAQREHIDVVPAAFLILEGVTASRDVFRPYLTYTIWIEASLDLRLRRGLERDGQEARAQWESWIAEEEAYRRRERPDLRANLVVSGERDLWT